MTLSLFIAGCGGGSTQTESLETTTDAIKILYSNSGNISFDWKKSSDEEQKLYSSQSGAYDDTARLIVTKDGAGEYRITCSPRSSDAVSVSYACGDGGEMVLSTKQTNTILLSGDPTVTVGSIEILHTQIKSH